MSNYYSENLNADKLFQVYDTNIERINRYLRAEVDFVINQLKGNEYLLEVGAGYGRILRELSPYALRCTGIDISEHSVALGKTYIQEYPNCDIFAMDVYNMRFENKFDVIIGLQNALSSLKGDTNELIKKCVSLLNFGGKAFFSTYSDKFWKYRLQWFEEQSEKGLLGEIDKSKTGNGAIICKDGFRSDAFTEEQLRMIGENSLQPYTIHETDESSVFLVIQNSEG